MELQEDFDYNSESNTVMNISFTNSTNSTNPEFSKVPTSIPFLPFGLGLIIIITIGVIGNILSSLVLSKKRLRSSYSVLTLGLTFADSVYLITKFFRYGLDSLFRHYGIVTHYTTIFLPLIGPYLRPLTFTGGRLLITCANSKVKCNKSFYAIRILFTFLTAHTASTYFTMAIALDRYIALSRPSLARKLCTTKKAMFTSIVVVGFALLYNVPRWWEFYTEDYLDQEDMTKYYMKMSSLRNDPDYKLYYIFWSYFIVMFCLPFLTLSILNLLVWKSVSCNSFTCTF
jgi:hypothetical protein